MTRFLRGILFLTLVAQPLAAFAAADAVLLDIDGPIGPATSDYVVRGLAHAAKSHAPVVILRMDTPGGLDTSMREIIRAIVDSPVPVAAYVAPGGARAASAGTYILYASHVAAMAPGTNLGAATPVSLLGGAGKGGEGKGGGDAMQHKVVNDAVAYIRSLAQMRGRNVEWAEKAVREAASLPADEALKLGVIDLEAKDVADLLARIDGRKVNVQGREQVLHTRGLGVRLLEPDWRSQLLAVITNPNVAYVLLLIGIYGLFFEFSSPGFVLPGVAGAIALVLALYAFHVLPVNYAGLGLILLGIAFMVAEAFVPSFGALGIGGVIAFVVGSIILMDTESPYYAISVPLILGVALASAGLMVGLLGAALKARYRPVVFGRESIVGDRAEVIADFQGLGQVRLQGELWQARSEVPLRKGDRVRVTALDGLTVHVEPMTKEG
jgi:membrane-bound serine protease (ClpP class)